MPGDLPDWQSLISFTGDVQLVTGNLPLAAQFDLGDVSAYQSLNIRTFKIGAAGVSFLQLDWYNAAGVLLFSENLAYPIATSPGAVTEILTPVRATRVIVSEPYNNNPNVTIDGTARVTAKAVGNGFNDYTFGNSGSVAWTNGQSAVIPMIGRMPQGLCQLALRIPLNPVSGWLYVQCVDTGISTRLMPLIDSQELNLQTGFATVSKTVILPALQGAIWWQSHVAATYDVQVHIVSSGN